MSIRVSELIGIEVVDRHGRSLGQICDLILDDAPSGTLCYAMILLPTGTADGRTRTVALPWSLLAAAEHPSETGRRSLALDVSISALAKLRNLANIESR